MTDKKMINQVTQAAGLKLKADLVTLAAARDKAISTAITSANSKFDKGVAKVTAEHKRAVAEEISTAILSKMKPELAKITDAFSTEVADHYDQEVRKLKILKQVEPQIGPILVEGSFCESEPPK